MSNFREFFMSRSRRRVVNVSSPSTTPRIINTSGFGDAESAEELFVLQTLATSTYTQEDVSQLRAAIQRKYPASSLPVETIYQTVYSNLRKSLERILQTSPALQPVASSLLRRLDETARFMEPIQGAFVIVHIISGLRNVPAANMRIENYI